MTETQDRPTVTVKLIGTEGNAFAIMGKVKQALRRAGAEQAYIDQYLKEATAGDYNCLLATTMKYVNVE